MWQLAKPCKIAYKTQQSPDLLHLTFVKKFRIYLFDVCCQVTHLATEASVVHLLSNNPAVDNFDLSSLVEVMSSASSLSQETSRNVKRRLPKLKRISQCKLTFFLINSKAHIMGSCETHPSSLVSDYNLPIFSRPSCHLQDDKKETSRLTSCIIL